MHSTGGKVGKHEQVNCVHANGIMQGGTMVEARGTMGRSTMVKVWSRVEGQGTTAEQWGTSRTTGRSTTVKGMSMMVDEQDTTMEGRVPATEEGRFHMMLV